MRMTGRLRDVEGLGYQAVARGTGLARETVNKYLAAAGTLRLRPNGLPPTDEQMVALVRLGSVVAAPRTWAAPGRAALEPHAERIRTWVQHDGLQLTWVQSCWGSGVGCSYMTLLRFVRRSGWASKSRSTVRVAESQPGEVAEIDYGRMGMLRNPHVLATDLRAPRYPFPSWLSPESAERGSSPRPSSPETTTTTAAPIIIPDSQ